MTKRDEMTTAWIHQRTRDRLNSCKPEEWTTDDLINEALDRADFKQVNEH